MSIDRRAISPALRIAAIYMLLGAAWILGSDSFVAAISSDLSVVTRLSIYKGWVFILASGYVIFFLLHRELRRSMKAEQALVESEARYRAIFEGAAEGILVVDQQTMQPRHANQAMHRLLGYSQDEFARLGVQDLHPKDAVERVIGAFHDHALGYETKAEEIPFLRKDGTIRYVDISTVILPIDGVSCNVGFVSDITDRRNAEKELRASKAKLDAALSSMTDAVCITDFAGNFVAFNEAFATFHKFAYKDECPETHAEYPKFLDVFTDTGELVPLEHWAVPRALRGETAMNEEYTLRRKDTNESWVGSFNLSPIRDQDGSILGSVITGRDITEQKKAQELLRQSEERLNYVLEGSREGFWDWNLETGEVQRNERWAEMLGYSLKEISFTVPQWGDLVHPDDKPEAWQSIKKHLEGLTPEHEHEYRMLAKDGEWKWILDRARVVKRNEHGKPIRMAGTHTDITERKKVEEALRASEQRVRAIADSTQDGIVVLNDRAQITYWNPSAERIFGFKASEVIGQDVHMLLAPHEHAESDVKVMGPFAQESEGRVAGRTVKLEGIRQHGESFPIELSLASFQTGDSRNVVAIVRDITERQKWEDEILKWSSVIEHAQWGVVYSGRDLQSLDSMNPAFARMHGYTVEELRGRPILEVFAPDERSSLPQNIAITHQRGSYTWESKHIRKDGTVFPVLINATAVKDGEGHVLYRAVNVLDITEQKEAEHKLRESEERYRTVADFNYDWEYWVDSDGKFLYISPSCERITGYAVQEFMDNPSLIQDIVLPEDLDLLADHYHLARHVDYHQPRSIDFRIIRRDGEIRWIAHACRPVYSQDGDPLGRRASNRDITDRKKVEEALAERELLYRTLFEGARDAIMMIDMEGDAVGRIVSANPVAAKIHGYTSDEFMTLRLQDLETASSAKGLQGRLNSALSGQLVRGEVIHRRKDGSVFPLELSASLFEMHGHKYCIAIDRDITERKTAEETLAAERSKFKSILDHMIDGVYIVNARYEIEYTNPALTNERGEVSGRTCYEYLAGRSQPCPWCRNSEVLAGESILWERTSEMTGKTYEIFQTPLKNQDGSTSILLILHDITRRKLSEKRLRESEQRYRALVDLGGNGIIVQDDEGRIITWNKETECIFGISAEDVLGKTFTDHNWKTFREDGSRLSGAEYPSRRTLATGKAIRDQIVKVVRPAGDFSWISLNTAPIFGEDDSKPAAVIITLTDFTERKEMERTLRENEQFLRQTERIARVGGWRANPFTDELHWTHGVSDIIEAPPDYNPGLEEGMKFCEPHYIPSLREMLAETLESGLPHAMEVEVVTATGKHLWAEVRSLMRVDESGGPLVLGTFQDITERKTLEQQFVQMQKMEAIGTLAGGVAHDFNNILQVAFGYSEIMLGDDEFPEHYREDLQKIHNSAKRGADLVKRLLTFSRKTEINLQHLDLNICITELRKMLERTLPKMVDIQLLQDVKLATINADRTQIDQILMNLAVNARDAMPDGGNLLFKTENFIVDEEYARTHLGTKPGPHVLLTVTDTGSGMEKETVDHIFEPFFTTKGVGEGTGLGLAMVHGIVKQHGGHISCHSDLGKGTTFRIYFPALAAEPNHEEATEALMPPGGAETILLVDDEELIRDLASRMLSRAGYVVITASNGQEALETYRQRCGEIALVLLDLMMPQMGGRQCLEGLLSINPAVKVIIASGYAADGATREALEARAKGFVYKPYDLRQVRQVVREVLDAK